MSETRRGLENNMIYLDNSATTALCEPAKSAMQKAVENYANPSSLHNAGLAAHKILVDAREAVGISLGVKNPGREHGQIFFVSCGTEANNTAILGTVYAKKRRLSNRILSTDSEHPSVENTLRRLESDGFEVIRISTRGGVLDFAAYEKALEIPPCLVTMMLVNNETGAVYDVARAFAMAKAACRDTVTHCDAVQGYMKVKFTPMELGADLLTVSAHKIHGPKGTGALYVSAPVLTGKKLLPLLCGGEQESGYRPGTENMVGIAGFGAAATAARQNFSAAEQTMRALREKTIADLSALGVQINQPEGRVAPHIVSATLPDIKSETMLHYLSSRGICVSSGSACSSHARRVSPTLKAFGLTDHEADCTLRISLCEYNTEEEIHRLCDAVKAGMETLIRIKK